MLTPYRDVLTQPGALRFSLAGFLARLPISMLTLGVVLLVSGTGRSYALAGAAAGAVNLGFVVAGPRLARLVDGYGQAAVLRPAAAAQAVALGALILAGTNEAPGAVLVALSLLTGMTMPSIGGLVRARWTTLLGGSDPAQAPTGAARLHTAFSFESVVDEVIFVVGPIAATRAPAGPPAASWRSTRWAAWWPGSCSAPPAGTRRRGRGSWPERSASAPRRSRCRSCRPWASWPG
ncbi:hypothetical protein GCM10009547_33290 [Sporichthya brevicatena]|uniref:MFS transporter n=1 Tax=Sporichthya brevicatena TaxID=171442 RepID=A0ABP3S5T3_9ACTN